MILYYNWQELIDSAITIVIIQWKLIYESVVKINSHHAVLGSILPPVDAE